MSRVLLFGILILALLFAGCNGATDSSAPSDIEDTADNGQPSGPESIGDTTPPAAISGLTVTPGNRAVLLVWDEPADDDFAKVEITYDGLATPLEVAKGNTSAEITGLTAEVEYTFIVSAVDSSGNKSETVETSTTPFSSGYASWEYFPITEGHGIKYHVTDDYDSLDCNVWVVSQYSEKNKPAYSFDLDFVFTLIEAGTSGAYRSSSILGDTARSIDGRDLTIFLGGSPTSSQGAVYRNFALPSVFSSGDEWSWDLWFKTYSVEYVGAQTVNGTEFEDCIKVTINDYMLGEDYLGGSGYFILARDIGIVQLVFNRVGGQDALYEYIEHRQLPRYTISGTIVDGGEPVEGIIVQISNSNLGIRSVTDTSGAFSVQVYGPDIILRIGYDSNYDDVLDLYPAAYIVNDITDDITGLTIDVSTLIRECGLLIVVL